jgi:hypothetical protein
VLAGLIPFAGCNGVESTPPATSSQADSQPTTTARQVDPRDLLRFLISDGFSAEFDVESVVRLNGGDEVIGTGIAVFVGDDMMLDIRREDAGLGAQVDSDDLGYPQPPVREEYRFVKGKPHWSFDGGRWITFDPIFIEPHPIGLLRSTQESQVMVEEGWGNSKPWKLTSILRSDDLGRPDFDGSLEGTVEAIIDQTGVPQEIHVSYVLKPSGGITLESDRVYRLRRMDGSFVIDVPDSWMTLQSPHLPLFTLQVPHKWRVKSEEDETTVHGPYGRLWFVLYYFDDEDATAALQLLLDSVDARRLSVEEHTSGMFPGYFVDVDLLDLSALYFTARPLEEQLFGRHYSSLVAELAWYSEHGPENDLIFREIVDTLVWHNAYPGWGAISGATLANPADQEWALELAAPIVGDYTGCEEQGALTSSFEAGHLDGWTEQWYFSGCGQVTRIPVSFTFGSGGSRQFSVGEPVLIDQS